MTNKLVNLAEPIKNMRLALYPIGDVTQWFGVNASLYKKIGLDAHNGADLVRPHGEHMFAVEDGTVVDVKDTPGGYGKHLRIISTDGRREWTYGHCASIHVKQNQKVRGGDFVARMGNCFDKETEILTNEGWKKFADLNKTETVATLNTETGEVEYHKPTQYTERDEEYVYRFSNYHSLDFAVTADHPMWVELQDGKMHTISFSDLPKNAWIKQSGGVWRGEEVGTYTIGETSIPMDTWLDFLGWFWSDGSTTKNSVRITQSHNNAEKREIIESILARMPFEVKEYGEDYAINNKELRDEVVRVKSQDSLPTYLFNLSARQIRIFLDAYWGGDGWMHKSTKYYITPNELVAGQLQELIMKCGGYATIKMRDPTKINRTKPAMIGGQEVISTKPYFVVTEGKHRMAMFRGERVEKIEYNDKVYCVTVENHIIYVRRNGRPMWCHNTGFVVSGNTPFWGHNPYAGTHLHLGLRRTRLDGNGWSYPGSTLKFMVLNYENGFKGSVDPLPYLRDQSLLSTRVENYAREHKHSSIMAMSVALRTMGL